MILLALQGVRKSFGTNEVLKDVSFTLQDGERMGLVGVNGSGKSTLMKILAGLETSDGGTITQQKGLRFGYTQNFGSENNDAFCIRDGTVQTVTNHCGGILGGITNGMPVSFTVDFKPTPSIALPQKSVSLKTLEETDLTVQGRHDPCVVPRAVPVVEAAAAIILLDLILQGA